MIPLYPGTREELAERTRSLPSGGFDVIAKYFREKYPDKPIMVSEGGMFTADRKPRLAVRTLTEFFKRRIPASMK